VERTIGINLSWEEMRKDEVSKCDGRNPLFEKEGGAATRSKTHRKGQKGGKSPITKSKGGKRSSQKGRGSETKKGGDVGTPTYC